MAGDQGAGNPHVRAAWLKLRDFVTPTKLRIRVSRSMFSLAAADGSDYPSRSPGATSARAATLACIFCMRNPWTLPLNWLYGRADRPGAGWLWPLDRPAPTGATMRIVDTTQFEKVRTGRGFFAALDQSGGSTPKALAEYGISRDEYSSEAEMFDLVHAMRTRVITSPAFDGSRILAAILFLQTMERDIKGVPTAQYLWNEKNVVPFLKVDLGLAAEQDDVQLMKPIETLDDVLERAQRHRIFGTKMRSVIKDANQTGIAAIVDQQFSYAERIRAAGLVPILEPEVSISSPHKEQAETLLCDAIGKHVAALPADARIMLKLTIPTQVGLYGELAADPRVLQVVALSGGYSRDEACALLARDPTLIASFSRALLEGLRASQTDEQFNAQLESSVEQIYHASVDKETVGG
jgi:fructose-bisphosphate aldolase, class I